MKLPLEVDVWDGDLLLFPLICDLPGGIGDEGEEEEGGVDDQLHPHPDSLLHSKLDRQVIWILLEGRQVHMSLGWQAAVGGEAGDSAIGQSQFQNTRQVILAVSVMEHVSI